MKLSFAIFKQEPRMDTNGHELLLRNEVFQIVGCAMGQKKI